MARAGKVHRPAINLFWLTGISVNWVVIIAAMTLSIYVNHLVAYLLAVLVIGTRQHALAVMLHDATHFHVSRNKRLNDLLANLLIAWPIPFSASGYRRWHFQHHRTVGTDADPELMMYRMFGPKWSPDANRLKLFVTDLIGLGSWELLVLWHDLLQWRPAEPLRRRIEETVGLIAWPLVMVGLGLVWLGWRDTLAVALLWYGAIFTSFFAVYRLRCYSEHIGSEWTHRLTKPALWERLLYLPANTWMHWEHHSWPAIPLHQMQQTVHELEPTGQADALAHLRTTETSRTGA
jgi:fatty acid desaturase